MSSNEDWNGERDEDSNAEVSSAAGDGSCDDMQPYPAMPGSMPFAELEESRLQRIEEGNAKLASCSTTAALHVLPVTANGECLLRALAIETDVEEFLADCRLLYILAVEGLLLHRGHFDFRFGEAEDVRSARLASVLSVPEFSGVAAALNVFSVYCLDKLEGAFETGNYIRERHWCDVTDIEALMMLADASIYICSVTENVKDCAFISRRWRDENLTLADRFGCDFFVLHWAESTFQHYDAVYCGVTGLTKVAPMQVQARLRQLIRESKLCQAFIAGNRAQARSIALRLLTVSPPGLQRSRASSSADGDTVMTDATAQRRSKACPESALGGAPSATPSASDNQAVDVLQA